MLAYATIIVMGLAGYARYPWWLVLSGAACLTLEAWWARLWRRPPRPPWSSKTTTYFITGIVLDIGLASLGFGVGRIARAVLG